MMIVLNQYWREIAQLGPQGLKRYGCIPIDNCNLNSSGKQQTEQLKPISSIDPQHRGQLKGGLLYWIMIAWGLLLRGKSDVSSLSSRPGSAATCTVCQCLLPHLIFVQDTTYGAWGENFCHVEKFQTESKTCTFFDGKMKEGEKWKRYMLVEYLTFLWRKNEPKILCVEKKGQISGLLVACCPNPKPFLVPVGDF